MCDKLFDDARLGMTHREVKQCTQMFIDIIELGRTRDADDDDEAAGTRTATLVATGDEDEDDKCDTGGESNSKVTDHHDPVGYAELMQVLQNNIWSNVDMDGVLSGKPKAYAGDEESAFRHELAEFLQLSSIDDGGGGGGGGRGHNNEEMFADGDKQFVKEVADLMMAGNRTSDRPNRLNADMNALSLEETEPDPGESECKSCTRAHHRSLLLILFISVCHSRTVEIRENPQRRGRVSGQCIIPVWQRALRVHANVCGRLRRDDRRRTDGRQRRRARWRSR